MHFNGLLPLNKLLHKSIPLLQGSSSLDIHGLQGNSEAANDRECANHGLGGEAGAHGRYDLSKDLEPAEMVADDRRGAARASLRYFRMLRCPLFLILLLLGNRA